MNAKTEKCYIDKKDYPLENLVKGSFIRTQLVKLIKKDYPEFSTDSYISIANLNVYRKKYLKKLIKKESKDLGVLENEIIEKVNGNKILSENIEPEIEDTLTIGQKIADKVAAFGGSWAFIISFFLFLMLWMGINIWVLSSKPFDPYPFILLNLILSSLAAIQAPIIMMSQNRQEQKDRIRGEHDFKVNLKSELEIQLLHEKIDHLIAHQNKRLLEIQELQLDYLVDITSKMVKK
ncbi:MAG: DUF1003 domain-containing protein [Lutibacter sp.]|uniref:DUF1003 domain-containing protein n=1 Tax=Lutibacter sp. TaxID=1925666 RepID=UPI00299EE769|nr:DUF1003 domain-containing protein [Lutibacter sp.]MDX1830144.1 DUF1003 domain-containing protein [Lutibacter sp.]